MSRDDLGEVLIFEVNENFRVLQAQKCEDHGDSDDVCIEWEDTEGQRIRWWCDAFSAALMIEACTEVLLHNATREKGRWPTKRRIAR